MKHMLRLELEVESADYDATKAFAEAIVDDDRVLTASYTIAERVHVPAREERG